MRPTPVEAAKLLMKIAIVFYGLHLSYSPTVIGLYDLLSEHFDVTILAKNPTNFDNQLLPGRKVIYRQELSKNVNAQRLWNKMFQIHCFFDEQAKLLKKAGGNAEDFKEFIQIRRQLAKLQPDVIIAADFRNLFFTQILGKRVEFLSLEIRDGGEFYEHCNFENINSVVIQTKERFEYLFKDKNFKKFLVQNAPIYTAPPNDQIERRDLVYCGTAWNPFGLYRYLDFLRKFPDRALTIKGALLADDKTKVETEYADLLRDKRLVIAPEYLDDKLVVDYLRQFRIGFCFYNFDVEWINTFNYKSAPSGKMFKYFAAGVPVIGQNILGLQPVKEFDCGVLIDDLKPETIQRAIEKIERNFDYYSENCYKAAAHYSFDKASASFIDYLKGVNLTLQSSE